MPTGRRYTVMKRLDANTTGSNPYAKLLEGPNGFFFGATHIGGAAGDELNPGGGAIFRVKSDGTEFTVLKSLAVDSEGGGTIGLTRGIDGAIYG
jgi:hypothetical protein